VILDVSQRALEVLAETGFSAELGARALRRHLDDAVLAPGARLLARAGVEGHGGTLSVRAPDEAETKRPIGARLGALDRSGSGVPWTRDTLATIRRRPHVAASRLAKALGRETQSFKADVRKLKRLGLTVSFEVGYDLSPRGRAFLRVRPRW